MLGCCWGFFSFPPPDSHQLLTLLEMTEPEKCKVGVTQPDSTGKLFICQFFNIGAVALPLSPQLPASPRSSLPSHIWDISSLLQHSQSQPNSVRQTFRTGHKRGASKCVFLATIQGDTHLLCISARITKTMVTLVFQLH